MEKSIFPLLLKITAVLFASFIFNGKFKLTFSKVPFASFKIFFTGYDKKKFIRLLLSIICVASALIIDLFVNKKPDDEPIIFLAFGFFALFLLSISISLDKLVKDKNNT